MTMSFSAHSQKFYINGAWIAPAEPCLIDVINPATEAPCAQIAMGTSQDVDHAVSAARTAFFTWSKTSREERLALLERILDI